MLLGLEDSIDQILLAIPSIPRRERRKIVDNLQNLGIPVLQVPSVDDLTSGRARIDALRPIAIEDLLGRDVVPADPQLLGPGIRDVIVCVTGAGGSIGSELCRQILALSPARLILLDSSEPALYAIEQELRSLSPDLPELQAVLGSATEQQFLKRLFADHAVQMVFHAAAYKHVPLVEANPLAGLANNVGSTAQVCRAAIATGKRWFYFYRQGCASQQRDGSLQASGRTGAAGPCRRGHSHLFFNGPFWKCAWFLGFSSPPVPSPNRFRWTHNPHAPGDHPLLHDHS